MLNRYYGIKQKAIVHYHSYRIWNIKSKINRGVYPNISSIDIMINELKSGKSYDMVSKGYYEADSNVFISQKHHDYILDVGETVKINRKTGIITSKKYDADTNTMYYHTDIVIAKEEPDNMEELLQKKRDECVVILEDIKKQIEEKSKQEPLKRKKIFKWFG